MLNPNFKFRAKVWRYPGKAAWHFVSVPVKLSKEIHALFGRSGGGWGSLRVEVTVGKSTWKTSIFPDAKSGAYVLPLKSQVRKAESIKLDKTISLKIELLV